MTAPIVPPTTMSAAGPPTIEPMWPPSSDVADEDAEQRDDDADEGSGLHQRVSSVRRRRELARDARDGERVPPARRRVALGRTHGRLPSAVAARPSVLQHALDELVERLARRGLSRRSEPAASCPASASTQAMWSGLMATTWLVESGELEHHGGRRSSSKPRRQRDSRRAGTLRGVSVSRKDGLMSTPRRRRAHPRRARLPPAAAQPARVEPRARRHAGLQARSISAQRASSGAPLDVALTTDPRHLGVGRRRAGGRDSQVVEDPDGHGGRRRQRRQPRPRGREDRDEPDALRHARAARLSRAQRASSGPQTTGRPDEPHRLRDAGVFQRDGSRRFRPHGRARAHEHHRRQPRQRAHDARRGRAAVQAARPGLRRQPRGPDSDDPVLRQVQAVRLAGVRPDPTPGQHATTPAIPTPTRRVTSSTRTSTS